MPEVIVRKGEPVDRALKRLKNKLDAEGILEEVRRLRAFETPSQKSRRKAKANAKRGRSRFRFNPSCGGGEALHRYNGSRFALCSLTFADDSEAEVIAGKSWHIRAAHGC